MKKNYEYTVKFLLALIFALFIIKSLSAQISPFVNYSKITYSLNEGSLIVDSDSIFGQPYCTVKFCPNEYFSYAIDTTEISLRFSHFAKSNEKFNPVSFISKILYLYETFPKYRDFKKQFPNTKERYIRKHFEFCREFGYKIYQRFTPTIIRQIKDI